MIAIRTLCSWIGAYLVFMLILRSNSDRLEVDRVGGGIGPQTSIEPVAGDYAMPATAEDG